MHEKGGVEMALAMSVSYSTKQMYDVLEMFDVYDSYKKLILDRAPKKES